MMRLVIQGFLAMVEKVHVLHGNIHKTTALWKILANQAVGVFIPHVRYTNLKQFAVVWLLSAVWCKKPYRTGNIITL
jgi:hypothetical protein